MKSNINKLILIEVIAGILFAFIASKILHMTAALQIMYLPFELIGKGLRFLSLSSAIGNVIAIIIYAAISMIPAIYIIYQRKRGRTQKEDILLVAFTGLLFYSMYMFINPGLMYQKMPDIFSMDQNSLIVMKIIYAFIIYSVLISFADAACGKAAGCWAPPECRGGLWWRSLPQGQRQNCRNWLPPPACRAAMCRARWQKPAWFRPRRPYKCR